jgi:hypothetical protein
MFDALGYDVEVRSQTDDELVGEIRDVVAQRRVLDAREARVLAELDARATCDQFTHDHTIDPAIAVPSRATLRALAFAELCRSGLACELDASRPPAAEAVIVLRPDDPYDPYDQARDLDGRRLTHGTTRTLRCAAGLIAALVDSLGVPLAMGRTIRTANRAQRRALALRDGGCVFPGCAAPVRWCDAHHFIEWDQGGNTDTTNLALLCRRHHGVINRAGWTAAIDDDECITITTPTGAVLFGQRHGRARAPTAA